MRPASIDWRTDKYSICSLSLMRSCVFITLSAFCPRYAKFLVHLFGEEKGGLKWERGEVGEGNGVVRMRGGKWEYKKK